jgi:hypothetical protein
VHRTTTRRTYQPTAADSRGNAVLVDQPAEQVLTLEINGMYGGRSIDGLVGRFEHECSVRPVPVVVQSVDTKDTLEMASAEDQEMVEAVGAYGLTHRSANAFAFGARTGVLITRTPSERKISSKPPPNFVSRSWISSRKG